MRKIPRANRINFSYPIRTLPRVFMHFKFKKKKLWKVDIDRRVEDIAVQLHVPSTAGSFIFIIYCFFFLVFFSWSLSRSKMLKQFMANAFKIKIFSDKFKAFQITVDEIDAVRLFSFFFCRMCDCTYVFLFFFSWCYAQHLIQCAIYFQQISIIV